MIATAAPDLEGRVAIWGPGARDASLIREVLTREKVETILCPDADCLIGVLEAGAGALLADEEAITRDGNRLEDFLGRQPAWSDLPVLLLTSTGANSPAVMHAIETLGNVTILERPARVTALVTGVLAALRSRTRQYQIRAHLAEQAEADRRKDEFLATLAHELRNPLAPIRSAQQILSSPHVGDDDARWARDVIHRQVTHLARLVEDLMDVSRIASGKIALRRERVALATVVEAAIETSRPLLESAGQKLVTTGAGRRLFVNADPVRLSQVVSNLLNNASKFTPRDGVVRLDIESDDRALELRITDTGVGIPETMLESVFELFTQAERPRSGVRGGLGIGLTLVRSFVELHGGTVEARSEGLGRGSQFVVRLPVIAQGDAAVSAPESKPASRPLRILVVDDNVDSADGLAKLLRLDGHDVSIANDGAGAVSTAKTFQPELVLLDIGLPDISGYDAARQIRALPGGSKLGLVALTGWGQQEDRRRSREAGFDRHLVKPVAPGKLDRVILELARRKDASPSP